MTDRCWLYIVPQTRCIDRVRVPAPSGGRMIDITPLLLDLSPREVNALVYGPDEDMIACPPNPYQIGPRLAVWIGLDDPEAVEAGEHACDKIADFLELDDDEPVTADHLERARRRYRNAGPPRCVLSVDCMLHPDGPEHAMRADIDLTDTLLALDADGVAEILHVAFEDAPDAPDALEALIDRAGQRMFPHRGYATCPDTARNTIRDFLGLTTGAVLNDALLRAKRAEHGIRS